MLQFMIAMDTSRNSARPDAPLDARSLVLSALLGTHPPVLPGRTLTSLAELFGMAPGTMRTALSRMVAAGELSAVDGRYQLEGRLLERQRAQDLGRRRPGTPWDGGWHTMVAVGAQRSLAERRRLRRTMADHRMGELRPDVWMRPDNLDAPAIDGWARTTGPLTGAGPAALAATLWDLDGLADAANRLLRELAGVAPAIAGGDAAAIPRTFRVAAATVRFLRSDPLVPDPLLPHTWPADELRGVYDQVESDLQAALRDFFAAER